MNEVSNLDIKIFFVQFSNPAYYPPLQHVASIFVNRGWKLSFISLQMDPHPPIKFELHGGRADFFWVQGYENRFLVYLIYLWFFLKSIYLIYYQKADWVYGSDHFSLPVLYAAKVLLKKRIIYHEHDTVSEKPRFIVKYILKFKAAVVNNSALNIIPNKNRVADTNERGKWVQVQNMPSFEEVPALADKDRTKLILHYHGSISRFFLSPCFLNALFQCQFPFKFQFAGYETLSSKGNIEAILNSFKEHKLEHAVEYLGVLSRPRLLEVCSKAHVGLSMISFPEAFDINLTHLCGASNKLFDYLAAGCAVLVSNSPEWHDTYARPGYGLSCDPSSAESISAALTQFYKNLDQTIEMGRRGHAKILSEWNYEKQFLPVMKKMESM